MSTNIDTNTLKNFLVHTLKVEKLSKDDAIKYDVKIDKFDAADIDENSYLDLEEIVEDKDLYNKFATLYLQEQEKKTEAKDKEKQKEEQSKVGSKSEAKA